MWRRARLEVGGEERRLRELAAVVRNFLEVRLLRERLHAPCHRDRLRPVLFLLVDRQEEAQRRVLERRAVEAREEILGAVEQPRAMEILRELELGRAALLRGQVRAVEQVLVHPDRAVDLALAAEETPEREVQIDRLRVDFDHLDERFDRLVGLLVQEEVQPAEVRQRQRARFAQQMADVDPGRNPAQREEQHRDRQQPPEIEFHGCGGFPRRGYLGPVNAMGTDALQGRERPGQGAKAKAGRLPGETLQRSDGRFSAATRRERAARGATPRCSPREDARSSLRRPP